MFAHLASKSVLVTGGSGFIGTHLLQALERHRARVTNLDVRPPKLTSQNRLWRECNLLDHSAVEAAITETRPSVVINLAAETRISLGPAALEVNTRGLANVLSAIGQSARPVHLVHTSTQLVMSPGHTPQHNLDFAPYSEYGQSKADSELLLHELDDFDGFSWTVVRPTNVWGPWHPTFADQIWKYIDRGLYMHPTGIDPRRSYGYVANVVHQLLRTVTLPVEQVHAKTFYVGDEPIPSSQWLDAFSRKLRGKPVLRVPGRVVSLAATAGELSGRLGGPRPIDKGRYYRMTTDYAVPMDETFRVLGRGPVGLEAGVDTTVQWMRSLRHQATTLG